MTRPAGDGGGRCEALAPKDGAVTKVQQLRERIECGTYSVSSHTVAEAILKRLLGSKADAK
jgi:beta-phosphoglucomutase-like phosphatase (HAD superfamily)